MSATATRDSCTPAFHKAGLEVAWGPMPQDFHREGGEAAVTRALDWIVRRDPSALEPDLQGPAMAFNLTVLATLLGTVLEPDFTGVDLLIEDVSEHHYRIDRTMFHVTASPNVRKVARLRLGRVGDIPLNDPDFGRDEVAIVRGVVRALGHRFRRPRGHRSRRSEPSRSVHEIISADFPLKTALPRALLCALSI